MNNTEIMEILSEEIDNYINNIAYELENSHDKWFENFGFPMFGTTSKDYHEQVYFQSYLESYTRKLINGILYRMFEKEVAYKINWPEFEYKGFYNGYTNSEYESEFGFQFLNNEKKVGYRYTHIDIDDIDVMINKYSLDTIKIVLWENNDYPGFSYEDERVQVITLYELFEEMFCEIDDEEMKIMRDAFISNVTGAVEQANAMISLVTLPGFTRSYLYKTRKDTVKSIVEDIGDLSSFNVKNKNYKQTEELSRKLINEFKLPKEFLEKSFENVFVGTSHFAKSFLTSEYLFHYFENNPMFDYTPIVSGYLKSIEQVLHEICISYRNYKKIYVDMRSYTLGSYTKFMDENGEIFRSDIRPVKEIIINCLDSYRIENRNHLFHKDYFDDWERVKVIRTNTIFLFVVILTSVEQHIITKDSKILGILNEDFNNLFQILEHNQGGNTYMIEFEEKVYHDLRKQDRRKGLVFDKKGIIQNEIVFEKSGYDSITEVVISKNNIPKSIWLTNSHGEKLKQLW